MNEKEISEIRRRFRPDKGNIATVCGCCVNDNKEIISEFTQSLSLLSVEEVEEVLAVIKKTLSGSLSKNLINIPFTTKQVTDSPEHKLLMRLRDSALQDEEARRELYSKVASSLEIEGSYMILLVSDAYDVPSYSKDGEKDGESSGVFRYILCSVCPIKTTKPSLGYYMHESRLRSITTEQAVSSPELGFMFPSFDRRSANIYEALYYTRSAKGSYDSFAEAVFASKLPMPAAEQKETFGSILGEAIGEDLSYELAEAVHSQLCEMIEEHKISRDPEPLIIDKNSVSGVLVSCGAPEERVTAFGEKYDEQFGAGTELSPKNIVSASHFEVKTPDITVKVNPERRDLVETRIIDGTKYILIRADGGVEVNGVGISINE